MDIVAQWLLHAGEALLKAALNPFSCLAWLILAFMCRRRTELERKLFAVRLHSMPGEWLRAFGAGLAAALAVSLAVALFGLKLTADAVYWTWGVVLVLMLFRLRFANLPAAAALIGVLQLAVDPARDLVPEEVAPLADSLLAIDLPSLWMLAALMLLAQAVLVRVSANRSALPLYVKGKRGKAIGAYQLHGLWLMPFMLVVPAADGGAPWWLAWLLAQPDAGASGTGLAPWLPWPMPFVDDAWTGGLALLAFPAVAGFVDLSVAELPSRRAKRLAWRYAAWGVAIGAMAVAARFLPVLVPAAAAMAILLPEVWQQLADRAERRKSPEFVQRGRGLKVLDVLVPSPAAEMGISRGETVVRANGKAVNTQDKLHAALRSNPAFSRLEVVGTDGENRFVQRPLYSGEHHLLGVVPCPDDRVLATVRWRPLTLWQLLRVRTLKHRPAEGSDWPDPLDVYAVLAGSAGSAGAVHKAAEFRSRGTADAASAGDPVGGAETVRDSGPADAAIEAAVDGVLDPAKLAELTDTSGTVPESAGAAGQAGPSGSTGFADLTNVSGLAGAADVAKDGGSADAVDAATSAAPDSALSPDGRAVSSGPPNDRTSADAADPEGLNGMAGDEAAAAKEEE